MLRGYPEPAPEGATLIRVGPDGGGHAADAQPMHINDAHCHFFSAGFFDALARQRGGGATAADLCRELQWDDPGDPAALADRWITELDRHGVHRTTLIASVPGDEDSVGAAVARHPHRFVGFFMLDPSAADAPVRARRAVSELGLRGICLFPAMHGVALDDERVARIVDVAAAHPGTAVFVHCGVLTVGVRKRLKLASRFDLRFGDPLALSRLALSYPDVPFIVPHFGAGLFRETLMAADASPNIHVDTSSSNSWLRYHPGLSLGAAIGAALEVAGPSRLLFGSDSSFFPRGWHRPVYEQQASVVRVLGVSGEVQELLFGGNFDRLFPAAAGAGRAGMTAGA